MMLLALALAAEAWASGDPNDAVTVHVALVHALKQDHPWGVRVGADWQLALGDHCAYREDECRGSGVYPLVGPGGAITWRGGPRVEFEADAEVGLGWLEMATYHFLVNWELIGRAGLRFEVDGAAFGLSLGGFGAKSFGLEIKTGETSRASYGTNGMGLRFDADTAWVFGEGWRAPTLAGGLWITPLGAYTPF